MMNLTSSKDFGKLLKDKSDSEYRRLRENFDNFLEKPLKLGYFIPCSEMDNPIIFYSGIPSKKKLELFEEAKQRVLFEGFEYDKENDWVTYNEFARFFVSELQNGKVEDLFKLIKDEITLTETAKIEIGYETT